MVTKILWSILLGFFMQLAFASEQLSPLPAAEAFVFSSFLNKNNELIVDWQIAPGYYLYRDQVNITAAPTSEVKIGPVSLPKGHPKYDSVRGHYQTYSNQLKITVPLTAKHGILNLGVAYQGCSAKGFCYSPITQFIKVDIAAGTTEISTPGHASFATSHSKLQEIFVRGNFFFIGLTFLGLGLLLAFTPCVLPMIPILSSLIVGRGHDLSARRAFTLSLAYVLGMAGTYALAGMVVALVGHSLQTELQRPWVIIMFSALFILLALSLFDLYELQLPKSLRNHLHSKNQQYKVGTYLGVFAMGSLSSLIVSPCVSAPLVGVLAYIGETGNIPLGAFALLALGCGMGIPLLLLGTSAGKLLPKAGPWMRTIQHLFGILLIAVAISLLSRVIPAPLGLFLWSMLFVAAGIFGIASHLLGSHFLARIIAYAALLYGIMLMIGALSGNSDPLHPFTKTSSPFTKITSQAHLMHEFAIAKQKHQPLIMDFYADWCPSCVAMERSIWNQDKVKNKLTPFIVLRADVTANNKFDQAMSKQFKVVAPPVVIFFNSEGKELARIAGETRQKKILEKLTEVEKTHE
jgi:thiol:disulfide interchange protein DsbD